MVPNHNFYKKNAQSAKKASNMSSSVLDECRDRMHAFWHDRVTPLTPKASK